MESTADDLHCFVPTTTVIPPSGWGSLESVRVVAKDLFSFAGHTSSFGHEQWRLTHAPAKENAAVVSRVLAAGATVVGLAKMDQLAYSLIGNVGEGEAPANPHDPACYCGGSSSGSASAVAGRLADVGLGTDTAGSIRVPAAACGLFSIRPTHDQIDKEGVLPLAPSLDVVGLLARTPTLLEKTFQVVAPTAPSGPALRRVLLPADLADRLETSEMEALEALAERIAKVMETVVSRVDVASLVSVQVGDLFARLQSREIWQQHAQWVTENIGYLAPDVQTRLRRCEALSKDSASVKAADREARLSYSDQYYDLVGTDGVLLLPVLPRRGPLRSWNDDELLNYRLECFRLTGPSSLTGAPQVVLPVLGSEPTTVPVSIAAWRGSDRALLSLASTLAAGNEYVAL